MDDAVIAAVLWDMDGTLIDSEPAWIEAQMRMVAEFGGTWTHDDGLTLVGADMHDTAVAMHQAGVDLPEAVIIERLHDEVVATLRAGIIWRPGARELVQAIDDAGLPQAIVTTSSLAMTQIIADALPATAIRTIVSGEQVTHGKPHPEPYLVAARRLGVDIKKCVAIEDSPTGLTAALAAHAIAIGVPHDAALTLPGRWTRLDTLSGLTLADLEVIAHQQLRT